ncbi:MAG: AAA-like domain-containing protein [Bacteroidota bacterium]|nr:AAA-like domain-containing protein [Bacteroidota bacterium]
MIFIETKNKLERIRQMKKEFTDTGLCVPNRHYMVDTTSQLKETIELIERGKYFIINRPRQFGKTTTIHLLEHTPLLKDYLILRMSFEGIGDTYFDNEPAFVDMFVTKIKDELSYLEIKEPENILIYNKESTFADLKKIIRNFINVMDKKVLLFIDEVDKSSNNQLFISFLGLLRDKYLLMNEDRDSSFHSVVLAGLHDVKNLKLKLRPDEEETYNSPWNIAVSYDVDMTFSAKQIETMLVDYVDATSANMNIAKIAEILYYYTSGYPYFVSKLCKIIAEKIKPSIWTEREIIDAVKLLISEKHNANFDKIIKILEENQELYNITQKILIGRKIFTYNSRAPLTELGELHGIFRASSDNKIVVFNKIYDEMIMEYMIGKNDLQDDTDIVQSQFLKDNGKLDLEKLLTKFKDAIEEKYSSSEHLKSKEFLEDDLRMKFFMYLKPVINGVGFSCKEVQTSEERRMDVVIFFQDEKFIVELKIWKGEKLHKQGIEQIKDYMHREHCDKGYMLIMNKNKNKEFKITDEDGIFTAWV